MHFHCTWLMVQWHSQSHHFNVLTFEPVCSSFSWQSSMQGDAPAGFEPPSGWGWTGPGIVWTSLPDPALTVCNTHIHIITAINSTLSATLEMPTLKVALGYMLTWRQNKYHNVCQVVAALTVWKIQQERDLPIQFVCVSAGGQGKQDFVFLCCRERDIVCVEEWGPSMILLCSDWIHCLCYISGQARVNTSRGVHIRDTMKHQIIWYSLGRGHAVLYMNHISSRWPI